MSSTIAISSDNLQNSQLQALPSAQPNIKSSLPAQSQPELNFIPTRYRLRCTAHQLFLNDQPIPYTQQILNLEKFYIIKTIPNSKLKTPIILHRNKQIDTLDRRIFTKKFVFQIVKSLEICSFSDAVFIIQRVPKQYKYFVNVIQGITLFRWKILLMNDSLFMSFYQCIQSLITKKSLMSSLRRDLIEDLLKTRLLNCHSRLFYMLDNLVLENEELRNSLTNMNKSIVLQEIEKKTFFEKILVGATTNGISELENKNNESEQSQQENSGIEDNLSTSDCSQNKSSKSLNKNKFNKIVLTLCPQKFLENLINVTKFSYRLKLSKQIISKKILNRNAIQVLAQFFKEYFQTQRLKLIEVLCLFADIQGPLMWEVVFEEGRNWKNKNLKFLQMILTNGINFSVQDAVKKSEIRKQLGSIVIKNSVGMNSAKTDPSTKDQQQIQMRRFSLQMLQKLISLLSTSLQGRQFINTIIKNCILTPNKLKNTKILNEQLQLILTYLQFSLRLLASLSEHQNQQFQSEVRQMWRVVIKKIESILKTYKQSQNPTLKKQKNVQIQNSLWIHLPLPKITIITLMKIYQILIKNEHIFNIELNLQYIDYLFKITSNRKGIIEGVRLKLLQIIQKGENIRDQPSDHSQ